MKVVVRPHISSESKPASPAPHVQWRPWATVTRQRSTTGSIAARGDAYCRRSVER